MTRERHIAKEGLMPVTNDFCTYANLAHEINTIAEDLERTTSHYDAGECRNRVNSHRIVPKLISFVADVASGNVPSHYMPLVACLLETWSKVYKESPLKVQAIDDAERTEAGKKRPLERVA
ncbi:MAG: hypothetical protein ABIG28_00680 [archaeon]